MRLHPIRTAVLVVLGLVVIVAAWVGWQVWKVSQDLGRAVDDAAAVEAAARAGDDVALEQALAALQEHSASAAGRTGGSTWSALTALPVFGDDADGVRTVSDVVSELSSDGLRDLTQVVRDLNQVVPTGGQVSIDAIRGLQEPVARGDAALDRAGDRLAEHDPSSYVARLRDNYRELEGKIADASHAVSSANTALQVMPGMLGEQGRRQYLMVFQNNAEVRATGGFPGAASLVESDDGRIEMVRQVAASEFGEASQSVLPLTPQERELYGPQLGTYFGDANFTPDFPRSAALMKARWEQAFDETLDGVFSIDPIAMSYLMAATGPVTVRDVTLTADNVVDEILHQTYLRYQDPADQDVYLREVARAVFDSLSRGGGDAMALLRGLARGTDEGRIYVTSFHDDEQTVLTPTDIAGALVTDPSAPPQVGVTLNDATGAKMSYFLRHSVRVTSSYCEGGVQGYTGRAVLESVAPADAASLPSYLTGGGQYGIEAGAQLVIVRVYGPVGGTVSDLVLNAKPQDSTLVVENGRPVETFIVYLEPGDAHTLTWSMESGPDQTQDAEVTVTPGIESKDYSSIAPSACD